MAHWSESKQNQEKLKTQAEDLEIPLQEVTKILGVERVGEYLGSLDDAIDALVLAQQKSKHWSTDPESQAVLSAQAQALGFCGSEVTEVLGVGRIGEYPGTLDEALSDLRNARMARLQDVLDDLGETSKANHHEAQVIAFTDVYTPSGQKIKVTAREGATAEIVTATTIELVRALELLRSYGILR